LDKDKAKRNLEVILDKMNSADMVELHEYHKLYKKEVSLFKRSCAAAWLFMYYNQRENPGAAVSPVRNTDRNTKKIKATPEKTPVEINLSEEESKRLFISIGKNRRLFPREVITLIMSKTSAAREDIGVIRILDNYSFVQIRDTKADEIIQTLTGHKFRGRTLTVNYAKPKTSDSESE